MLKSKLQFFVSFVTFCLFIATLVICLQEGEAYVGAEELWKKENWNFWPK